MPVCPGYPGIKAIRTSLCLYHEGQQARSGRGPSDSNREVEPQQILARGGGIINNSGLGA